MMGLEIELKLAADVVKDCHVALSVSSGCELFTRFVTRTSLDVPVDLIFVLTLLGLTSLTGLFGVQTTPDRAG